MMRFVGECNCGHTPKTCLPINPAKTDGPPHVWVECSECHTPTIADRDGTQAKWVQNNE